VFLEYLYLGTAVVMAGLNLLAVYVGGWLLRTIRQREHLSRSDYRPRVSLIIPCKGAEEGLAEHLATHFRYDYPHFEIVFAVADVDDPAVPVIRQQIAGHPQVPARVVVAPRLPHCVEKISNQLAALAATDPRSEVFAFADSDGVPRDRAWLRALVAPLETETAATGFRWYFPDGNTIVGNLHSSWDSTWCVYHAFEGTVWGGAMALTRKTYQDLDLGVHLSRGVTDDLVVLARVRAAGGRVCFVPGAMVGSRPHRHFRDLLSWAVRQAALVRLVTPGIWLRGFLVANFYALFYLLTLLLLAWPGEVFGRPLPAAAVALLLLLNVWRARRRYRIVCRLFPGWDEQTRPLRWRYVWYIPPSDLLGPYVAWGSLLTRVIRWRGVGYRVLSDRVVRIEPTSRPSESAG
jgi:cellulose synthase/poly-beta-1,6-N-acetylglucosamine synthase-like glycosyltransferase